MRQTIALIIERIVPLDTREQEHQKAILNWISSGEEIFRIKRPDIPNQHLSTYAVLVDFDREQVLLTEHKKSGLWLPGGGHVDYGENPKDTAVRELAEEFSIKGTPLTEHPFFVAITPTVGPTAGHVDVGLWFVFLQNSSIRIDYDLSEFASIRWFPWSDLPHNVDKDMGRFMQKLEVYYTPSLNR